MFGILRKRFGLIVWIVLLSCSATGLASYYLVEPKYEASTKLIVNQTSADGFTWDDVTVNVQLVATYMELIQSWAVMEQVAAEHPEFGLSSIELSEIVSFRTADQSQVMTVTVEHTSYETAALAANAVAHVFKEKAAQVMQADIVTILNDASLERVPDPVSPSPLANTAVSFVVALIFATGIAFLLEHLNDTIRSEKDVEQYLELPTLAIIGTIDRRSLVAARSRKSVRKVSDNVYVPANR